MSLNQERFHPLNLWKAIGTGIGTLIPPGIASLPRLLAES